METFRYKPKSVEIPEAEPFKDDLLARKDSAEILTEFTGSLCEPFVLAIDSPWGTGKTTFLQMWRQHLKNQGFPCLYFNAWENDFSDSPLVSLIGEIGSGIESLRLGGEQEKAVHKVFEKTKKAGAALLKAALPTALKLATSGLLDLSAATVSSGRRITGTRSCVTAGTNWRRANTSRTIRRRQVWFSTRKHGRGVARDFTMIMGF